MSRGEHRYHPDGARRTPVPPDSYYEAPEPHVYDADEDDTERCPCGEWPAVDYYGTPMCADCAIEHHESDVADRQIADAKENW